MNISHNERRAHFHTFLLLYLFVFIMPDPLFASCLALPCAPVLPVLPGYVPVALLAPFRGRRWARRWQRGAGTATKGSIESSSKGRGGRQVASEHRAGRQRARNNESSAEHKHSPLPICPESPLGCRDFISQCLLNGIGGCMCRTRSSFSGRGDKCNSGVSPGNLPERIPSSAGPCSAAGRVEKRVPG